MIRYENNQIILSGKTAKSFDNKLNNPKRETIVKRDIYFKEIKNNLSVKTVNGKTIIK
ncbi:hypothetical protein [Desulfitobacterium sp.]|uniref:hypothetical protein n=1 Tax=Desulfitobacterium sp. TaxID=49981 RepID=UPI002BDC53FA|nr:hypothetical protein [Desulfitobacterium sp.]HVJ48163.1 hypothetical protein [Desulfitobacterium sp.]